MINQVFARARTTAASSADDPGAIGSPRPGHERINLPGPGGGLKHSHSNRCTCDRVSEIVPAQVQFVRSCWYRTPETRHLGMAFAAVMSASEVLDERIEPCVALVFR